MEVLNRNKRRLKDYNGYWKDVTLKYYFLAVRSVRYSTTILNAWSGTVPARTNLQKKNLDKSFSDRLHHMVHIPLYTYLVEKANLAFHIVTSSPESKPISILVTYKNVHIHVDSYVHRWKAFFDSGMFPFPISSVTWWYQTFWKKINKNMTRHGTDACTSTAIDATIHNNVVNVSF